ncbi:MAG: hypothetical protein U1A78_30325 [Polyangia bacterium]
METECCEIDELLVEYHFAAGLPTRRDRVHDHLIGCSACARRYFNLKQSIEQSAELGLRPSVKARTRLRAAVGALAAGRSSTGGRPPSAIKLVALRRFFRTPVPRYQVAAAVLLVLLGTFASRFHPPTERDEQPGAQVATHDGARDGKRSAVSEGPRARYEGEPTLPVMVHELPSDMPPEMPIQVQPGIRPAMRGQPVHLLVLPSGRRAVVDSARSQAVSLTFY